MNRLKVLIFIMMTLGTHAYSQIVVTNPGTGPVRPPIDPPPVDNPIPVRPTTPDGIGIFDGSLYEYCGPAGYKCNLMRTDAVSKMLDESRAYSAKQLKAHQDSLDAEMAKLDSDLNAARSGVVSENSPAGQVLKGKLTNAANTKAQAVSVSDETLAFQVQASQEQSSSIDVGLGLAFKEQDKKEYREEVKKVELVVANRFLDAKLKVEMNRADAIESQINQGNFSNKQQRLEMVSAGRAAFQVSAQSLAEGDLGTSDFALKVGTTMLDVAISVTPILGWGKDLYEASFGKNLITGEELNGFERSMAVIGVLTGGLGSKLAIAGKGAVLIGMIKSARGTEEATKLAKIVEKAADTAIVGRKYGFSAAEETKDFARNFEAINEGGFKGVLFPRGPGAAAGAVPPGHVPVSRWISESEVKAWYKGGGTHIPSDVGAGGRVYVTSPGAPRPGGTGGSRVDFTLPEAMLTKAGNDSWFQIFQDTANTPIYNVKIFLE